MPEEKLRPTYTFTEDRLAELRAVVPEAFEDGSINWDTLRDLVAPYLADESPDTENFGLSWPGKREARRLAAKPSGNTLRPAPGEGINEDTTHNLYLEGDNLEVLKLLQKSYAGGVKMIYIDPPYNTGNDFVYKDNFSEPSEDYLRRTEQVGERGELLTSNPITDGRFHSNWLNMIYPRLRLARTLLRDDGVIFISIDDNEVHNLREVLDEVFGPENFITAFIWKRRNQVDSRAKTGASVDHEYCLVYRKSDAGLLRGQDIDLGKYKNPNGDPKGPWASDNLVGLATKEQRPNLHYDLVNPETNEVYPCSATGWRYSPDTMKNLIAEGRIIWPSRIEGRPRYRRYLSDLSDYFTGISSVLQTVYSSDGTRELSNIFHGADVLDFPKPVAYVKLFLTQATNADDIVLDFFSGSGTTADAIMQLNQEDGGSRRFILIQIPEATPAVSSARKAGFKTITEIGKERLRRAAKRLENKQGLALHGINEDLGFKVLTLGPSNFRAWRDYTGDSVGELQQQFDLFEESPLAEGWTPDGLLTEVLLLEGFPLDSAIAPQPQWKENTVSCITSPACGHRLWTCFDETLHADTVNGLTLSTEDVFICRDSALDDNAKLRLSQTGTLKTI